MYRNLAVFLLVPLLSSCTAALIEESHGKKAADDPANYTSKITYASILNRTAAGWARMTYIAICYRSGNIQSGKGKEIELTMDFTYPENKYPPYQYTRNNSSLIYYPASHDIAEGCSQTKKIDKGWEKTPIPVIEVGERDNISLPSGHQRAVYVKYENNRVASAGYISTDPFYDGAQQIIAVMPDRYLYTKTINSKPYLLLLTPITAIGDAIGGAAMFGVMAVGCSPPLNQHEDGCM